MRYTIINLQKLVCQAQNSFTVISVFTRVYNLISARDLGLNLKLNAIIILTDNCKITLKS